MAKSDFDKMVERVNRRIKGIKEAGMQPITLKSPADIIERFVERKGTGKEGLIKTWSQVQKSNKEITREEYEASITEFLEGEYGQQTYFREALNYYTERMINQLIEAGFEDEEISRLHNLPKREFINALNNASELAKADKDSGGSSNSFYYYLFQYLDEKEE